MEELSNYNVSDTNGLSVFAKAIDANTNTGYTYQKPTEHRYNYFYGDYYNNSVSPINIRDPRGGYKMTFKDGLQNELIMIGGGGGAGGTIYNRYGQHGGGGGGGCPKHYAKSSTIAPGNGTNGAAALYLSSPTTSNSTTGTIGGRGAWFKAQTGVIGGGIGGGGGGVGDGSDASNGAGGAGGAGAVMLYFNEPQKKIFFSDSDVYINGTCTSNSISIYSDYRIKDNVTEIPGSIDVLRPVLYRNKITNNYDMGFIAHEVQKYFPHLVTGEKDDKDSLQSVNYNGIIALLIKEIQYVKNEIKQLKNTSFAKIDHIMKDKKEKKF